MFDFLKVLEISPRLNEQTGVQDIYEAYIHFLGNKYFLFNLNM